MFHLIFFFPKIIHIIYSNFTGANNAVGLYIYHATFEDFIVNSYCIYRILVSLKSSFLDFLTNTRTVGQ